MKKGSCYVDCGLKFMLFMAIVSLLPFLTFMNDTPAFIVTLRFVSKLIQFHLYLQPISKDDTKGAFD